MLSKSRTVAFTSLFSFSLLFQTSCGKKGQLEYETAQMEISLSEQKGVVDKLQAESAAIGNLGYYNNPETQHLDLLNQKIKALRDEGSQLAAEKVATNEDLEVLQKELSAYRSHYVK